MASKSSYKYFHFSLDQMKERKATFDKLNKDYVPGTVVYNGRVYEYTNMGDNRVLPRYTDARLVAEGDIKEMTYTEYSTRQKGMTH